MIKVNERDLKKYIGRKLWIEHEGAIGNWFRKSDEGEFVIQEGLLFGILSQDEEGFYLKMFQPVKGEDDQLSYDKDNFMDEIYRIRNYDILQFAGTYKDRVVRLSPLEKK